LELKFLKETTIFDRIQFPYGDISYNNSISIGILTKFHYLLTFKITTARCKVTLLIADDFFFTGTTRFSDKFKGDNSHYNFLKGITTLKAYK